MSSKLIIGIFVLLITAQCSNSKTSDKSSSETNFGSKIRLSDLNGKGIDLSAYKGKTVILNIWATWCKPCIKELPSMKILQNELGPNEFKLLFASDEGVDKIKKFIDQKSYDLDFISLVSSPESLGIFSLPTTFIIGKDGKLLLTETGSKDWGSSESIQEIKKLSK